MTSPLPDSAPSASAPTPQSTKGGTPKTMTVIARTQLSPHLVRLTLRATGEALVPNGCTDAYVKVEFTDPADEIVTRTYTVRAFRGDEIDLDFVVHGEEGLAGPWAQKVALGSEVTLRGPGGGYAPDPNASEHLFVGDLAALPAIEVALAALAPPATGQVLIAITDPGDQRPLDTHLDVQWICDPALTVAFDRTIAAVEALPTFTNCQAFVHGEAGFVRQLRRHLKVDRGLVGDRLSISGYWKLGRDDAGWRQEKREWNAPVDEAEAAVTG